MCKHLNWLPDIFSFVNRYIPLKYPLTPQGYVEMSRLQVSTDTNGTTVSSQLSFTGLQESHSGLVQCLVMQRVVEGGEDTVLSSVATLTVLREYGREGTIVEVEG